MKSFDFSALISYFVYKFADLWCCVLETDLFQAHFNWHAVFLVLLKQICNTVYYVKPNSITGDGLYLVTIYRWCEQRGEGLSLSPLGEIQACTRLCEQLHLKRISYQKVPAYYRLQIHCNSRAWLPYRAQFQ